MKLNRITLLSGYKNIERGCTLEFSKLNYTSLVGANGSGKSNWIEVVASVMLHLIEKKKPHFDYSIYLDEKTEVRWEHDLLICKNDGNEVEIDTLDLPKKLMVCYSGEDRRLWDDILMDSYANYFNTKSIEHVEEPDSLYFNHSQWAIALIVLMCSQKPDVKSFVDELWMGPLPPEKIILDLEIDDKVTGYDDPDTQKILDQIRYHNPMSLREVQTFDLGVGQDDNNAFCRRLYYLLYALSMPVANTKRKIQMQKAIKNVQISAENGLSLKGLSEGHKKRILITLMTQVIGDDNTVYLFDEPDAHVDVAAKSKILELIEKAPGHILLTTHSPLMTKRMDKNAVQTVMNGNVNPEDWKKIIDHLSDHQFVSVDNFLLTLKRKVVITEGKYDVYYIREAVRKLKGNNPDLERLDDVAFLSIGGAGDTKYFLENSLDPVMGLLEKVVILFDKDSAGDNGFRETDDYKRNRGLDWKIEVLKYSKDYPDTNPKTDFYVEDYFPVESYAGKPNIIQFNINGQPAYYEIKKMSNQSSAIKTYLENNYSNIKEEYYKGFLPLLREIIQKLSL